MVFKLYEKIKIVYTKITINVDEVWVRHKCRLQNMNYSRKKGKDIST